MKGGAHLSQTHNLKNKSGVGQTKDVVAAGNREASTALASLEKNHWTRLATEATARQLDCASI